MSKTAYRSDSHLQELHESGFEMAKGEPDIRNWKVVAMQGREIGTIKELLFNEVSRRVRYLVVELNGRSLNLVSRSVLVPIALAQLHRGEKVVSFRGLTVGHIASLPSYEKGRITDETEREIRSVFAPSDGVPYQDEDFNDNTVFENGNSVVERSTLKEEIKENIERVKETVRRMEADVERLGKNED
jgi:PRC-barrel domain